MTKNLERNTRIFKNSITETRKIGTKIIIEGLTVLHAAYTWFGPGSPYGNHETPAMIAE